MLNSTKSWFAKKISQHWAFLLFTILLILEIIALYAHSNRSYQTLMFAALFIGCMIATKLSKTNPFAPYIFSTASLLFYSITLKVGEVGLPQYEQIVYPALLLFFFVLRHPAAFIAVGALLTYHPSTFINGHDNAQAINLMIGIMSVTVIISTRNRLIKKLAHQRDLYRIASITDSLTGLYVLHYLLEHVQQIVDSGKPVTVILIDMKKFKQVNDTYGHLVGNQVLIHVANILRSFMNNRSGFIGRLGGDEFVIFMTDEIGQDSDEVGLKQELTELAEQSPFHQNGLSIPISFSVGSTLSKKSGDSGLSELLHAADIDMYLHKNTKTSQGA